jgi:regulatory protein
MSENALFKTALNKAMALCSQREYCTRDIQDKLRSWGIGTIDIEKIIDLLKKENFINEERFAKAFVKDKFNYNKWGKVKISSQLRAKQIPGNIIKSALDSIDHEVYTRVINDLITSHRKSVKAKNQYDLKAKLLRYGLSKGFESSILHDILNRQLNDSEGDPD